MKKLKKIRGASLWGLPRIFFQIFQVVCIFFLNLSSIFLYLFLYFLYYFLQQQQQQYKKSWDFRRTRPEPNPRTCKNHGIFEEPARSGTPELEKKKKNGRPSASRGPQGWPQGSKINNRKIQENIGKIMKNKGKLRNN